MKTNNKPGVLFYGLQQTKFMPMVRGTLKLGANLFMNNCALRRHIRAQGVLVLPFEKHQPENILETAKREALKLSNAFSKAVAFQNKDEGGGSQYDNFMVHLGSGVQETLVAEFQAPIIAIETAKALFDNERISLVVVGSENTAAERALIACARQAGIATLQIASEMYGSPSGEQSSTEMPTLLSDYIAVFGERSRRYFSKIENHEDRVIPTGYPVWDQFYTSALAPTQKEARQKLNMDEDKTVILFCSNYFDGNWAFYPQLVDCVMQRHTMLLQAVEQIGSNTQIVVHLHPGETETMAQATDLNARMDKFYLDWLKEQTKNKVMVLRQHTPELFAAADIVVTVGLSTMVCEAMLRKKPVIALPWFKEEPRICTEADGVLFADSSEQLIKLIQELRNNPAFLAERLGRHQTALRDIHATDDGKASLRVAELIMKLAGNHKKTAIQQLPEMSNVTLVEEIVKPARQPRILHVAHAFPPQNSEGSEQYSFNFSCELAQLGYDVTTLYPVRDAAREPFTFKDEMFKGVKVCKFNALLQKSSDFWNPEYHEPFQRYLQENEYDLVYFQHVYHLSAKWISIAKESGLPVFLKLDDMFWFCHQIYFIEPSEATCGGSVSLEKCFYCFSRDFGPESPAQFQENMRYLEFRKECLKRIFNQVDFVHTPSQYLKMVALENNLANEHFDIIRAGILPFKVKSQTKDWSTRKQLRVAFIGEIHPRNGLGVLLKALKYIEENPTKNSRCQLEYSFYGNPVDQEVFESFKVQLASWNNAQYKGMFLQEERADIFEKIDLLVMPCLGGCHPLVACEALFAGVPVIASHIAGVSEIVQHGNNGFLFTPGDYESLARRLLDLAAHPEKLDNLNTNPEKIKTIDKEAGDLSEVMRSFTQQSNNKKLNTTNFDKNARAQEPTL